MLNTTDLLIKEGQNLANHKIPLGYEYMGESFWCPKCDRDGYVYADAGYDEDNIFWAHYKCTCGFEWNR
jgi:DNA-directed RNA polymerase subunit M/transcription elongation factor TFIIS